MTMLKEFKAFILRGNVLDLAVAVIIGGAFGNIVSSLVNDILMPPIGLLMGGVNFSDLYINLSGDAYDNLAAAREAGAAVIAYGTFLQTIIDFLLVAFAIFMVIKAYNSIQAKKEEAPAAAPEPSAQEKLLAEIRDLLKK
ncbi:MAG: large-conductance mechanosensitive channel protein MscL [Bacteroidia bacterium]|nr:large-conductance mechanosensitive channel protein MscL [Bacteroidia bacterium]